MGFVELRIELFDGAIGVRDEAPVADAILFSRL